MTANVHVFYYTGPFTNTLLPNADALIARLNPARKRRFERRVGEQDRALDLASLRLLELGMQALQADAFRLVDVDYPVEAGISGKPKWLGGALDFNISHSAGMAACAISRDGLIGLDVEPQREIDPRTVRRLLADDAYIANDLTTQNAAHRWTQIEAVLKTVGLGVMHGREIQWRSDAIVLHGQQFWVQQIDCGADHLAHIATTKPVTMRVTQIFEL